MCTVFNVMPKAGGLLDQDKLFIYVLQNTLNWKRQREELDRQKTNAKVPTKR